MHWHVLSDCNRKICGVTVVDFHTDAGSQEVSTFQTQGNDQPVEGAHTLVFGTKSCCET